MCYIGSEQWESKFDRLLSLVKEYIVDVWEIRKHKLYDIIIVLRIRSTTPFSVFSWVSGCARVMKSRLYDSQVRDHVVVHLGLNVSSSAHNCGCVVNGGNTMAAI